MANAVFRGDAPLVSQVTRVIPGTLFAGHTYGVKINGKVISVVAATDSAADLVDAFVDAISASLIPEFQEVVADGDGDVLVLTSQVEGLPFVVTTTSGDFETDAYIVVTVSNATGGTFPLTYHYIDSLGIEQTETTSGIAITATAATMKTNLEGLTHVGAGNVDVSGPAGGPWVIHWTGSLARTEVLPLTTTNASLTGGNAVLNVSQVQAAVAGTDEVQTVDFYGSPTGGTRQLVLPGYGVAATVAYNASNATVQAAVRAAWGIGATVTVSGTANVQQVFTFSGAMGHKSLPAIQVYSAGLTGGTIYADATVTTPGAPAINQINYVFHRFYGDPVQAKITITKTSFGSWSAGSWFLTINGTSTGLIPYNATDPQIAAAVEAALGIHGILVGSSSNRIFITFDGPLYDFTLSTVTVGSVITGGSVSVSSFLSGVDGGDQTPGNQPYAVMIGSTSTTAVNPIDSMATVQAKLDAAFGAGNTVATALEASGNIVTQAGLYKIELKGIYSGASVALSITQLAPIATQSETHTEIYQVASAGSGANEVVSLAVHGSPTVGDFTATFGGYTTAAIDRVATAPVVTNRFTDLPNISATGVAGTGGALGTAAVVLTFGGEYSYTDVGDITINDDNLKARTTRTTPGVTGKNQIQRVSIAGQQIWGGTLTVTAVGDTTGAIQWNDNVDTVAALLIATSGIGPADILWSGGPFPEASMDFEFTGALKEVNQTLITGTLTSLKNGIVTATPYDPMLVSIDTPASGPNHWNNNANWTTGRVPDWGDSVTLSEGDTDILYGLRQVSTFTVDTVTDQIIPAGCDLIVGQKVRAWSTGTLPAGLATGTDYYITAVDSITGKLKIATSAGGTTLNITGSGSGTHTIGVQLTAVSPLPCFFQDSRYTGHVGLPQQNENGYWEGRPRYLAIGIDPAGSKTVILGQGPGSSSGLIRMDYGTDQVNLEVLGSAGSSESGVPAINILNTNSASVINVFDGELGIAYFAFETSTINRLNERAGSVTLGSVTFAGTQPMIDKTGGELVTRDQATMSGVLRLRG